MKQINADQLIIGGGIIGLCIAYFLKEEGFDVTIIDKGPNHEAASHGNCGLISPSHAIPLNDFKLIKKAILWMLQSNAPFYVKPRFDPHLLSWMIQFALNAKREKVYRSMIARYNLMESSKSLYSKLISENQLDCSYREDGILFVCKKEDTFNSLGKDISFTENEIGLTAKSYVGWDLMQKEPAIKEDIYGAWLYEVDGHLKSDEFIKEIKKILVQKGVHFLNSQEVSSITKEGSRIKEVQTKTESIRPNNVIIASGALAPLLLKQLGVKVPVVPGKGYSITMDSPDFGPKIPCIFQERKTVATPWKERGYRLGGTMEFSGYSKGLSPKRIQALKDASKEYLVDPYTNNVYEEWWGWRSMTPDGVPIIEKSDRFINLFYAFGHNMLGMSMGPATGKLLTEIIMGKATHLNPEYYRLNRF